MLCPDTLMAPIYQKSKVSAKEKHRSLAKVLAKVLAEVLAKVLEMPKGFPKAKNWAIALPLSILPTGD